MKKPNRAEEVLLVLDSRAKALGPTEIGLCLGLDYYRASGAVMSSLRWLIAEGAVERTSDGKYVLKKKRGE